MTEKRGGTLTSRKEREVGWSREAGRGMASPLALPADLDLDLALGWLWEGAMLRMKEMAGKRG
jgi:hypothetical protein